MFCPVCKLSMKTVDEVLCNRVCRDWKTMEGTIEEWRCSDSRCIPGGSYTILNKGRRKCFGHHHPIPEGSIVMLEEV